MIKGLEVVRDGNGVRRNCSSIGIDEGVRERENSFANQENDGIYG